MRVNNLLIGTDFEVFLQKKDTKEIVSAEGIILGTKENPFCFDRRNKHYKTSLDNVLAEANIPPAANAYRFTKSIQKAMQYINSTIDENLCIATIPSARLDMKYLQTQNAKRLGCDLDMNAYTEMFNDAPNIKKNDTIDLRSAGGHIHLGYDSPNEETNYKIIRVLDLFIGIPGVIQEPDNERKTLYGKAGAMRHKQFGVEYRSPSNYYLASENLTKWIFNSAKEGIKYLNNNEDLKELINDEKEIISTINNNDREKAEQLIKKYNLQLVTL